MSVFADAIDDLFADPDLAQEGLWRAGGTGTPVTVRIIVRRPTAIREFGSGAAISSDSARFEVRRSEVPDAVAGDLLEVDGASYIVQGGPQLDDLRLVWTLDTRPA